MTSYFGKKGEPLRVCNFCGLEATSELELELFRKAERSKHGHANSCKSCYREQRRNGGKYFESELSQKKDYNQTEQGKRVALKTFYNWKENNHEKYWAQFMARIHTELDNHCEICNSATLLERHHPDYSKPFDIRTLCVQCHKDIHRGVSFVS